MNILLGIDQCDTVIDLIKYMYISDHIVYGPLTLPYILKGQPPWPSGEGR